MENNFGQGIADTAMIGASAAAPGGGSSFLAIVAPTPGIYKVKFTVTLTGTAETALANIALKVNSVTVLVVPSLTGQNMTFEIPRLTVAAGNVTLTAVAGSTAGSVYSGILAATRVE